MLVLRVIPQNGKLTMFDPLTGQLFPKDTLQGQTVYYAYFQERISESWLAGHIEPYHTFPSYSVPVNDVGLYRVHLDDVFN